jgi:hypothetical protein
MSSQQFKSVILHRKRFYDD